VYYLSEKGLEQFPTSYLKLTNRLLDQMKRKTWKKTVLTIFSDIARDLAAEYAQKSQSLPMEQRLTSSRNC
jgi:predicted ArsR family transcriptional regulator